MRRAAGRPGATEMPEDGIVIPHTRLAPEVLRRVMQEFVTRDGTDYGGVEKTLEEKVRNLARRLECGEAVLTYDPETGTTNVVPSEGLPGAPSRASRSATKGAPDG